MTAKLLILLIRVYQVVLSPFVGGACRFQPSCSAYAIEAVATHGAWRGSLLAARRLSRCHPLGRAGFDPVPVREVPNLEPRSSNLESLRN
jgi:uncharacterized protein